MVRSEVAQDKLLSPRDGMNGPNRHDPGTSDPAMWDALGAALLPPSRGKVGYEFAYPGLRGPLIAMQWSSEFDDWVRMRVRHWCKRYRVNPNDVDDLEQEVLFQLHSCQSQPANPYAYANRAALNAVKRHLMRLKPVWWHVKDGIVDLCRGDSRCRGFARWRSGGQDLVGYECWLDRPVSLTANYLEVQQDLGGLLRHAERMCVGTEAKPAEAVKCVLDYLGTPVPLPELTRLVFAVLRKTEFQVGQIDPCRPEVADAARGEPTERENGELIEAIVREVWLLLRDKCAALVLHQAADLVRCFLEHAKEPVSAEPAETRLERKLEMVPGRLSAELEGGLAWPDIRIAEFLSIACHNRQKAQVKVINLRSTALRTIARKLLEKRKCCRDGQGDFHE
jgi:hypothetical protein